MEGFNRPAGAGDHSDPRARATSDIRARCPGRVEVLWDDNDRIANPEVHKLKIIARDLPMVFPVERDVLIERGEPYRAFVSKVVSDVRDVLGGKAPAPPTS